MASAGQQNNITIAQQTTAEPNNHWAPSWGSAAVVELFLGALRQCDLGRGLQTQLCPLVTQCSCSGRAGPLHQNAKSIAPMMFAVHVGDSLITCSWEKGFASLQTGLRMHSCRQCSRLGAAVFAKINPHSCHLSQPWSMPPEAQQCSLPLA